MVPNVPSVTPYQVIRSCSVIFLSMFLNFLTSCIRFEVNLCCFSKQERLLWKAATKGVCCIIIFSMQCFQILQTISYHKTCKLVAWYKLGLRKYEVYGV